MSNYLWITFDCYGTLIDWERGITAAFEKIAMAAGAPFDRNQILKLYRKYEKEEELQYRKYRDVLTRVARRVCFDVGLQCATYDFLVDSLPRWRPFNDTNTALQRLARRHKLGILSNIDNDLLAQTRKHLTVNFELIVTAENVASYKPELNHFQEARRKIANAEWVHAAQSYFHDILPVSKGSNEILQRPSHKVARRVLKFHATRGWHIHPVSSPVRRERFHCRLTLEYSRDLLFEHPVQSILQPE